VRLPLPALIILFIIGLFLFGGTRLPNRMGGSLSAHSYDSRTFNKKVAVVIAAIAAIVWIAQLWLDHSAR
jgi:hypothetical protein